MYLVYSRGGYLEVKEFKIENMITIPQLDR